MLRESLLVVDKAPGPSSFDIVRKVKRRLEKGKVGHTGSLDPFASGVLILLLGRATKLSNVLLNADKSYEATIKLGQATDSLDRTGEVVEEAPVPELTLESIRPVVKAFEGTWHQTPPMFSAKKIKGVRLYKLARKKIEVPREKVPVELYRVEALEYTAPYLRFEVHCSKGTYVRSLADEIGKKLGTLGHLHALRRLRCGTFSIDESVAIDDLLDDFDGWLGRGHEKYRRFLTQERHLQVGRSNGNTLLH